MDTGGCMSAEPRGGPAGSQGCQPPGPFPQGGLDFLPPGVSKWPRRGRGGWRRSVADRASTSPRHSSGPHTPSPPGLQPPEAQPHSWNRSPSPPGRLVPRGQAEAFAPPLTRPRVPALRPSPRQAARPPTRRAPPSFRTAEGGSQKQDARAKAGDQFFTLNVSQGLQPERPRQEGRLSWRTFPLRCQNRAILICEIPRACSKEEGKTVPCREEFKALASFKLKSQGNLNIGLKPARSK